MAPVQYRPKGRTAREIAGSIEAAVRGGVLEPGGPLGSVRGTAAQLGVAPGTVAAAYQLLRDRGLVQSRGRSGTYVRSVPAVAVRSQAVPAPAGVRDLASGQPDPRLLPALGPRRGPSRGAAPADPVLPELLELGRDRLAADGVAAGPVALAAGGLDGIGRVLAASLRPGDVVAVEDPGWPNALDLVAALGLRTVPLPVDDQGPRATGLQEALRAGARAVIVTSRAHNPTGAAVTAARARQLRRVLAAHPAVLVVEDDHAAELAGTGLAALGGSTRSWAFVRSTSKPYGPDLRLAVVTGDETTMARVQGRQRVAAGWVSTVLQRLVLELWTSERAAAAVGRAAVAYDQRRAALLAALAERGIAASGRTGLNVWVPVADETAAVTGLLRAGWAVAPGARFRQLSPPGIRITVSGIDTAGVPRLADAVAAATATAPGRSYSA